MIKRELKKVSSKYLQKMLCNIWKKTNIRNLQLKNFAQDLNTLKVIITIILIIKINFLGIKEWHNTSFCLSLLQYNEKGLRKLLEQFDNYREKLSDNIVMENFQKVLTRLRRI